MILRPRFCFCLLLVLLVSALQAAEAPLVVRGGFLVDLATGQIRGPSSVIIRGARIERIEWDPSAEAPEGARVLSAEGKFLIPGLIDMHVHYRDWVPELFVNHGVTSVRDMANQLTWLLSLRQAREAGLLNLQGVDWMSRAGPRIFVAGVINTHPRGASHHYQATGVDEARTAVTRMLAAGVDGGFKLHDGTSLEMLRAVCRKAHQEGSRATAHLTRGVAVREAVLAGLDGIEHSRYSFSPADIALMLRKGVYWTPMLMGDWRDVVGISPEDAQYVQRLLEDPGLAYLPGLRVRILKAVYPPGGRPALRQGERAARFRALTALVKAYVEGGGKLLAGCSTYFLSGFALHQELALLVETVGLSPLQALQTATVNAAQYLGRTDLGRIRVGARADLVVLEANPLEDIRNTRRIASVIMEGRIVSSGYHADFVPLLMRPVMPHSTVFYGRELLEP